MIKTIKMAITLVKETEAEFFKGKTGILCFCNNGDIMKWEYDSTSKLQVIIPEDKKTTKTLILRILKEKFGNELPSKNHNKKQGGIKLNEEQLLAIKNYLRLNDKFKNSFFWDNLGSAWKRRSQEIENSFEYLDDVFSLNFIVNMSCRNVYLTKEIFVYNRKRNALFLRNLINNNIPIELNTSINQ